MIIYVYDSIDLYIVYEFLSSFYLNKSGKKEYYISIYLLEGSSSSSSILF